METSSWIDSSGWESRIDRLRARDSRERQKCGTFVNWEQKARAMEILPNRIHHMFHMKGQTFISTEQLTDIEKMEKQSFYELLNRRGNIDTQNNFISQLCISSQLWCHSNKSERNCLKFGMHIELTNGVVMV